MRQLLLAVVLAVAASPALAYCPIPATTEDRAQNLANQRELMLCEATQLHDQTAFKAQQLQFQADLQAAQKSIELDQKMQQTFAAAASPVLPQQY